MANVWFADCEVFKEDWLFVFKNKRSGYFTFFHNEPQNLIDFLSSEEDIWLCGYNFRDYDQFILRGILCNMDNAEIKFLNDTLISGERDNIWELFPKEKVTLPPIIDLFHDIVPRKSLKEIEANIGMDVQETEVSFDLDRELTDEEFRLVLKYCMHDVEATEALYYKRLDYLSTKKTLCELADLDDAEMMKHTNARVVAEALRATPINPLETFGTERYMDIFPYELINWEKLPTSVQNFVSGIDSYSGWYNEMEPILFDLWGTPTVMGIGGIHASTGYIDHHVLKAGSRKGEVDDRFIATPKRFSSEDNHKVLMMDIGSFYPSMMIIFDYLSRAVDGDNREFFHEFYRMRMEAKAKAAQCEKAGDTAGAKHWKQQANAAKLVLNTVYGCMKNQYSKLYDPFMATCVCITGQLLIIDLMNRIHEVCPRMEIVQLNTDGWVLYLDENDVPVMNEVVKMWCDQTGFTVETDEIDVMFQRDVNNYVIRFANGKVKAKGGTVKNWAGGTFQSNSCSIVDLAIVQYLLNGVPLEQTVRENATLDRLQVVLRAGSMYHGCCIAKPNSAAYSDLQGRVHRVYAVKGDGFTFYKVKEEGGNPARFPDAPENALEDFQISGIDMVDLDWYTVLAQRKLDAFTEKGEANG